MDGGQDYVQDVLAESENAIYVWKLPAFGVISDKISVHAEMPNKDRFFNLFWVGRQQMIPEEEPTQPCNSAESLLIKCLLCSLLFSVMIL